MGEYRNGRMEQPIGLYMCQEKTKRRRGFIEDRKKMLRFTHCRKQKHWLIEKSRRKKTKTKKKKKKKKCSHRMLARPAGKALNLIECASYNMRVERRLSCYRKIMNKLC
jgi:hypothetical protein